jgi:hypothetical protein
MFVIYVGLVRIPSIIRDLMQRASERERERERESEREINLIILLL